MAARRGAAQDRDPAGGVAVRADELDLECDIPAKSLGEAVRTCVPHWLVYIRLMELHDRGAPFSEGEPALPEPPRCGLEELAPPDVFDPVIEAFKRDVDRTLLRANLRLSVAERMDNFQKFMDSLTALAEAGRRERDKRVR
jgi:hypothetical protein